MVLGCQIGRGGYGKVYHSRYRGRDVAVKVMLSRKVEVLGLGFRVESLGFRIAGLVCLG